MFKRNEIIIIYLMFFLQTTILLKLLSIQNIHTHDLSITIDIYYITNLSKIIIENPHDIYNS